MWGTSSRVYTNESSIKIVVSYQKKIKRKGKRKDYKLQNLPDRDKWNRAPFQNKNKRKWISEIEL